MKKKILTVFTGVLLFINGLAFADVITSFEDLRDGKECSLTGKIFQIVDEEGFLFEIRKGYTIDLVFVKSDTESFFEGQKLTIEGKMDGTFSYIPISEIKKTVPYIIPEKIK